MLRRGRPMHYTLGMKIKTFALVLAVVAGNAFADDLDDYVAAVHGGKGDYVRVGSTYVGNNDIITRAGSSYVSGRGIATKAGSTYNSEDGEVVTKAGSTFNKNNDTITQAGSTYNGNRGTTVKTGSYLSKP